MALLNRHAHLKQSKPLEPDGLLSWQTRRGFLAADGQRGRCGGRRAGGAGDPGLSASEQFVAGSIAFRTGHPRRHEAAEVGPASPTLAIRIRAARQTPRCVSARARPWPICGEFRRPGGRRGGHRPSRPRVQPPARAGGDPRLPKPANTSMSAPCSHNIAEGRHDRGRPADRHGDASGVPIRGTKAFQEGIAMVHEGAVGKVLVAKTWTKPKSRPNIGQAASRPRRRPAWTTSCGLVRRQ